MSQTAGHNSTEPELLNYALINAGLEDGTTTGLLVESPNGTVVVLVADPITGGIKVEQRRTGDTAIMSAVPLGLGRLVLDGRTE